MKNRKTTSLKAVLTSVLSLVLCCSMLVGASFAWFTDRATTDVNVIQSGTLDVALETPAGTNLEGQTLKFQAADGRDNILWEPNATYELQPFVIKNNGNLALKYKIEINVPESVAGQVNLQDVIEFKINDGAQDLLLDTYEGYLLPGESSAEMVMSGHMLASAGNEYMNKTLDNVSITVYAAQHTYEQDSFGPNYDADAQYETVVYTASELAQALSAGGNVALAADIDMGFTVQVLNDATIDLNGFDLTSSVVEARPIQVMDDVTLFINAGDSAIDFGTDSYGIVEIPAGVKNAKVVINGGDFTGTTVQGAFIKVRPNAENVEIVLNDVEYADDSAAAGTVNPFVMNTNGFDGNLRLTVNGGSFTAHAGFQVPGVAKFTGAIITTEAAAFEVYGTAVIEDCDITVAPGLTVGSAPAAAIAVSHNGSVTVSNCTITGNMEAPYFVYSSGGTIIATDNDVSGANYTALAKDVVDLNSYPDAKYYIAVNGNVEINE